MATVIDALLCIGPASKRTHFDFNFAPTDSFRDEIKSHRRYNGLALAKVTICLIGRGKKMLLLAVDHSRLSFAALQLTLLHRKLSAVFTLPRPI